jgi:hypothetical protein
MKPQDQVREWLDQRCGRRVHIETHYVNSAAPPLVNAGPLTRQRKTALGTAETREGSVAMVDLYQVGTISYNLADLPDEIEVHIRTKPADQLEMTFDDGASLLIKAMITVIQEEDGR